MKSSGFDAVIGNPPWGQKAIDQNERVKKYMKERYSSLGGIFDLFRPFVEHGISLTNDGGMFGMVLPDIILLKDYPDTRRFILDQLAITRIDWWGMAFPTAVIDAATIVGRRGTAAKTHSVEVAVHDPDSPLAHSVPQSDFVNNPRCVFNLHLTKDLRAVLASIDRNSLKFGDFFEAHEGVHSGNIRQELFVERKIDDTCRPLYFGRDEIRPYVLNWKGKFVRLGVTPTTRSKARYANVGRKEWYDRPKLLVRRTGDYILAAGDENGYYASNNFFVVFSHKECGLSIAGLSALLNSKFMTWYFRLIEPRKGRVFAEVKIKHLRHFPIPRAAESWNECEVLNELGNRRTQLAYELANVSTPHAGTRTRRDCDYLDTKIERTIEELFEIEQYRSYIS